MIIYNQAFDIYHTIFRILQILKKFEEGNSIEIERIRIWDFYLLFPEKIHEVKLKKDEKEIREHRKMYIKDSKNPYEKVIENRKIFEKIKPYQLSAINCIASYGIIDKNALSENIISIISKSVINDFIAKYTDLDIRENNVISFLNLYFSNISLYGPDGLKNRTNLIESKYDA